MSKASRNNQQLQTTGPKYYQGMPPLNFTAIYMKVAEGFVGFIEELPGANTQGATLDEARENLKEAAAMVMEANRVLAEETIGTAEVIREPFSLPAA